MVDLAYYLTSFLSFENSLLYYYVILWSSIIFCLCSGDVYLSLDISSSFVTVSEYSVLKFSRRLQLSQQIYCQSNHQLLLPCFKLLFFEAVLSGSATDCLARSRSCWLYLPHTFSPKTFTNIFVHIFSKRQKPIIFYMYLISWLNWIARHFFYVIL